MAYDDGGVFNVVKLRFVHYENAAGSLIMTANRMIRGLSLMIRQKPCI